MAVDELLERAGATTSGTTEGARRSPRGWLALLTAGFLVQAAWRLYLSWPVVGPVAHADEDGYLLAARVVGGGVNATLPGWSIMRPIGYPLLISPIHWFTEQPIEVYRGVHVINAVLGALIFPLLYLLGRRLFDLSRVPAAALGFLIATIPSAVFFSQFALTDAFLPTLVLALLLAIHGMVAVSARHATWSGIAAGALVGYAANTHVRGLVMMGVVAALVVLGLVQRWISRRTAIATGVAAAVLYIAGRFANTWLEERMFADGSFAVGGRVFDRLTSIKGVLGVLIDAGGQIWHLCTSTWGLGAFGLVAAGLAVWRREGSRQTRIVWAVALVMTAGIAVATATGIPYETEKRVNNHVYGRYVAILAGFWVLVGIVALLRASTERAVRLAIAAAALTLATLGAVVIFWSASMKTGAYVNFDSPELSFLTGNWQHLQYYRVTAAVVVLIAMFAVTLPRWPRVVAVGARWWKGAHRISLVAVLVFSLVGVVNLVAMRAITDNISMVWAKSDYHGEVPDLVRDVGIRPGDSVTQATSVSWMLVLRHQHEVYWEPLQTFDPTKGRPAGSPLYVIASTGTGRATDWYGWDYGYEEVRRFKDGVAGICVVWRLRDA